MAKPSIQTQVIDARMGEEEQNSKQKEEQKKETVGESPTQLPGPFGRLLRPAWIIRCTHSVPGTQGELLLLYLLRLLSNSRSNRNKYNNNNSPCVLGASRIGTPYDPCGS